MANNLSGTSLADASRLECIRNELAGAVHPAQAVCFEITKTAAIATLQATKEFIHALRKLGCRCALDDFGSGLSSFAYLKPLPVDYLKIDGAFIRAVVDDPVDHAWSVRCLR